MPVFEINAFDELLAQRSAWDRLWRQTREATFFHSFDWFAAYWRHYGHAQQLRALLVTDSTGVVGLVPLVVRSEPTRIGSVRVLTYPLHDWGSFYGPLGNSPQLTLTAAMEHLHRTPHQWDLLDLRWLDPALDQGTTHAAMAAAGLAADEQVWNESAVVDLSGDWPSYWQSRTTDWRNNVKRSERKLASRGKVHYLRYRSATPSGEPIEPRWDLYETCVGVAGQSWQSTATNGTTLTHQEIQQFLHDAHAAAAACGAIDINLLYLDDRPAAFAYNYASNGWVYGLRTGYDAQLSRDGSGTVLMHRMLQDSFERGDRLIDLGAGYLQAKRYWLTGRRASNRCTHFPATAPRAQVLRLKRWLARRLAPKQHEIRQP